jgi:peptide/nickel transport system permease protein
MKQFILRRPLLAVVTLIGVSWLIFAILWMIPGDVAIAILGDGANPERVAALRAQMGLNDPWYVQYGRWAKDMVRGDLGTSLFIANKPVNDLIAEHLLSFPKTRIYYHYRSINRNLSHSIAFSGNTLSPA